MSTFSRAAWRHTLCALALVVSGGFFVAPTYAETDSVNRAEGQAEETDLRVEVAGDCRELQAKWLVRRQKACREYMAQFREPARLRPFVRSLLSLAEKGRLVGDKAGMTSGQRARTQELFRKLVLDDRALIRELQAEMERCHLALRDFDFGLLTDVGVDEQRARELSYQPLDSQQWSVGMQSVVDRAMDAAQQDAYRWIATQAASIVIADGVVDGTRMLGLHDTRRGSLEDFLIRGVVEIVAGTLIEEATDPTDEIIKNLQAALLKAENEILAGPQGLFARIEALADRQTQLREAWLLPRGE